MTKQVFNTSDDWFVGFTDGDGCFYKNEALYKNSFIISQHERSRQVLEGFKTKFGCGNISGPDAQGQMYFTIGSKEDLKNHVFPFFFKHPLQSLKNRQNFKGLYERVMQKPCPSPYDNINFPITINNNWLAGFSDAEAHFQLSITSNDKKHQFRVQLGLQLSDRPTLEAIKTFTNMGEVYDKNPKNANPYVSWEIGSKKDCREFLNRLQMSNGNTAFNIGLLNSVKFEEVTMFNFALAYSDYSGAKKFPTSDRIEILKIYQGFIQSYHKYTKPAKP